MLIEDFIQKLWYLVNSNNCRLWILKIKCGKKILALVSPRYAQITNSDIHYVSDIFNSKPIFKNNVLE